MGSIVVSVDALRSVAFGSITNSYTAFGTEFGHPMRLVRIINNTNGDMLFSFDTVNDNIFVPAGSFVLYDLCTNTETNQTGFFFRVTTQFYIKYSTMPTSGAVYLEAIYGQRE